MTVENAYNLSQNSIEEMYQKYPYIEKDVIYEIYKNGFDCHKAKINDVIIQLFFDLGHEDSEVYRESITKLYLECCKNS